MNKDEAILWYLASSVAYPFQAGDQHPVHVEPTGRISDTDRKVRVWQPDDDGDVVEWIGSAAVWMDVLSNAIGHVRSRYSNSAYGAR